jgi:hypothetical protein
MHLKLLLPFVLDFYLLVGELTGSIRCIDPLGPRRGTAQLI